MGITSYIRYIVELMSVCLLLSQINQLVSLYWFWSIKNTKGHICRITPVCTEVSLQTHSKSRVFWSVQVSSDIPIWKLFGMTQLIFFKVYFEGRSLIFSRMCFERKILPLFSLISWHCAHQLCNAVWYFSVCPAVVIWWAVLGINLSWWNNQWAFDPENWLVET